MDMCYEGALVMPSSYAVMDEEEMTYVEGGIGVEAVLAIILSVAGGTYAAGCACGERIYYAGVDTMLEYYAIIPAERQILLMNSPGLVAFQIGLENKLLSMIKK
ncbi:MAG: hypothetical protein ACI4ES_08055 [Roseburia sp.]